MRLPNYFLPEKPSRAPKANLRPIVGLNVGDRHGRLTILAIGCGKKTDTGDWTGKIAICACTCGSVREYRAVDLRRADRVVLSCPGYHPCSECGEVLSRREEPWHRRAHQRRRAAQIRSVA